MKKIKAILNSNTPEEFKHRPERKFKWNKEKSVNEKTVQRNEEKGNTNEVSLRFALCDAMLSFVELQWRTAA